MGEFKRVKTFQEALEIARAFAAHYDVHDSRAEAYAESWYEAGKDYDKASADDLRAYLLRRFDLA
ncbi:hypothetical protein [Noviherbaspirillum saxi]|uniref:Uncharacterized protein n=1 Tax=Noviherbaspirillum saxi TaxID=2320863 RepID=A0A3A3FMV2_9BURK|nr:hypothetical protein [Noviherbaspirillum saxi]RJF92675.1 hypothetical protein D3871_29275 [Noviherbaspirillum saxi]